MRSFASDNNAGVHPTILEAITAANEGHAISYGDDRFTESATACFRDLFGSKTEVFFVFTGTAGNVLGLQSVTRPHNAVICTEMAHLNVDECGAPEKFTGCKLLAVNAENGKLVVDDIRPFLENRGFEHHVQPGVVSLTQATEVGTVYTIDEIKAITEFAHANGLLVHVDGARLANAAVHLDCSFREITAGAGVDIVTFGGTKNGMMFGEAVIFFDRDLCLDFKYIRKQGMQLGSKMRFLSAQFDAYLKDDLWRKNAEHSNRMAQKLAKGLAPFPEIRIMQPVETNGVFAEIPAEWIKKIREQYFFYVWDASQNIVRWMTSFDTTEDDIAGFLTCIRRLSESKD